MPLFLPPDDRNGEIPFLSLRNALECALGAVGVFALCMIGQKFYAVAQTLAAPLWPSSGLALALLLLGGWRLFPAISLGTIAATTAFGDAHLFSIAGSVANTLESLIGWFLMVRVFGFSNSMTHVRDIIVLMLAGAPWGTMVSAVICTLGLVATGAVNPDSIPLSSLLFWTGNVLGILIFTPLFLRISQRWSEGTLASITLPAALWSVLLSLIVIIGFGLEGTAHTGLIPLAYLSFPLLVWLSFAWRRDVTMALALVTVLMTAFTATGHGPLLRTDPMATYAEMTIFIAVYAISCLILMAAVEEGAANSILLMEQRLTSTRKEAELRSIRNNLNPHFLFNSLNTIKSLVAEDGARAQQAIVGISQLLRSSLEATSKDVIPLGEELSVIRNYLDLQKLRFEKRLIVELDVPESCEPIPVPPMLFHQLVENAIKHGIEPSSTGGSIGITARLETEARLLRMQVGNTGTFDREHGDGFGLHSVREQLAAIYGDSASLVVEELTGKVVITITVPTSPRKLPSPQPASSDA